MERRLLLVGRAALLRRLSFKAERQLRPTDPGARVVTPATVAGLTTRAPTSPGLTPFCMEAMFAALIARFEL